jgi:hypothetical protein
MQRITVHYSRFTRVVEITYRLGYANHSYSAHVPYGQSVVNRLDIKRQTTSGVEKLAWSAAYNKMRGGDTDTYA